MKSLPTWAERVLRVICPDELYEQIEGDLIEIYNYEVKSVGERKAKMRFVLACFRFFRPGILLRNKIIIELNSKIMFRNHLKLAFRHILRARFHSVLNISGLAIGIATAFLIFQYLNFELGYDTFLENKDAIYRVTTKQYSSGELKNTYATTFYGVGSSLKENFSEVEDVTRFYKWPASTGVLMMAGDKIYNERNYVFADEGFFRVFPSLLYQGDPLSCLSKPNSIAISKQLALKLFGTYDVIGKTVNGLDKLREELVITAIIVDLPENAHIDLDVVRPRDWIPDSQWDSFNDHTYVTLKHGTTKIDLEAKLNRVIEKNQKDNPSYRGISLELQNVTEIHLNPQDNNELKNPGNKSVVYSIGLLFIIVLLVAWINHINFETARFIDRIKEVGLRRIVGSSKSDLILQFFVQYICIHIIAIMLAGVIVYFSFPQFSFVTGVPLVSVRVDIPSLGLIALALFSTGAFIACLYPSLLLFKVDPIASLKGKITKAGSNITLRRVLVIFQFATALSITAFVIVIIQQIDFMRESKLNFNLDRILTIYNPTNYSAYEDSLRQENNAVFRNALLQNAALQNLTSSSAIPGEPIGFTYVDLAKRTMSDPDRQIPYKVIYVDYDFIPVFGLKVIAGRNYEEAKTDYGCLVVTESTVKSLGFSSSEEAVDKEIYFMEDEWDKWKIIGVVEDYRHEAVKVPINPTIFRLHRNKGQMVYYSMLLSPGSAPEAALLAAEKAWKSTWPEKQFDYFFLDEYYDQQFASEVNFRRIFVSFSLVAILISCLGILGMTLLDVNVRFKEISIRKVLGASRFALIGLLSKNNFLSILWSVLISIPVTLFLATRWLNTYPARVTISWAAIGLPAILLITLVVLTSGLQTLRAASTNPTNHLKSE